MIVFVTTASHRYTHRLVDRQIPAFRRMSYPALLARRRLPRATYVFSDTDRLSFWQLELAAHVFRALAARGCRVLNDPARVLHRLDLLRRLRTCGINSFAAWPAADWRTVDRFPVFLRTAAAHRGNLTDPIPDPAGLARAVADLIEGGRPLADLMIVEYRAEPMAAEPMAAEPIAPDIFRKLAVYRVGDRLIAAPSVHERGWSVKYGQQGVAGEAAYARDLDVVRTNPYRETVSRAFEEAGIEYGRADFGIVGGRPEIYEINTNPMIQPSTRHPFADRLEAFDLSHRRYLEAVAALDTPAGGRVRIDLPAHLSAERRRARLLPGYLWMP